MGKPLETIFMNARRHTKRGDYEAARTLYEGVLLEFPQNVRARQGLDAVRKARGESIALDGAPPAQEIEYFLALFRAGKLDEAQVKGAMLLRDYPRSVLLHDVLGQIHYARREPEHAVACFRRALAVRADCAEVQYNLARVLQELRENEDAASAYHAAIAHKPDYAEAYNNLGALYLAMAKPREAIGHLQSAIKLKPDYADAYNNLGNAYRDVGNTTSAIAYYNQVLTFQPGHARAHYNLGLIHHMQGKVGEAIMSFERAMFHAPEYSDAHREMAALLLGLNLREEAIEAYQRGLKGNPHDDMTLALLLHQQGHICDWEGMAPYLDRLPELGTGTQAVSPWGMLALEDAPARHRIRSELGIAARFGGAERTPIAPPAARPEKIKVGYFTSDIHHHATMFLLGRMIALHDRDRFEVHAYSYGAEDSSAYRSLFDRFYDVHRMDDQEVAALARKAGLDIAIDLKGHTKDGRLGILSYGAAPVQMSYLGYPGTSGADFIDYMIADRVVVPDAQRAHYSESMIYLPGSYQVNDNCRPIADAGFTRAQMGLPENAFVFACFNNPYKITPEEFDIWMRLLKAVEGSVLWLYKANPWAEANLRKEAEKRGVEASRIVFAEGLPVEQHLARQHLADLFLDTFNVNAHTTASDALWGGLPILTRMGEGFAARVAGSLLHAVGLPELAVETSEAYEALALELASNPARLEELRTRLAANRLTMPLFDTEGFVRHIEAGYEAAYDRFLNGEGPTDIEIAP
ncbi:MAG: tetratricopeptide repeat protein [Sphingobium sp.]|jgi:protein O-GlcNAc transferase|nr:tetratricopeptide repeat protein [Sphingobium sp.]MCI1271440.1 tetratricopeptide repeat protein [Sphingobium sp.]MCI1755657.1 tetratricopeptide repeat protein [Sphingobium sp.]MCI2052553.1 tetratricopeptide repeat protein [Sphingobium sp.]